MNRFALNRATLNGATYALVLAFASVLCSASVSAAAIRRADALAPSYSSAELVASAQVTQFGGAQLDGVGGLYPQITHTQAATSTLQGTAAVTAFVLRQVQASSAVYANADVVAIAAGVLAQAQPSGNAQLVADATRQQSATSSAQGTGIVILSVAPTIFRNALVNAQASASVRAETSIRTTAAPYTLHSAYIDIGSNAEVIAVAVATRPASASVLASGDLNGVANIQQPGRAMALNTADCTAIPTLSLFVGSRVLLGVADITAIATRVVWPVGALDCAALVTGAALQRHAGGAPPLTASAEVIAQARVTQYLQALLTNTCETTSSAVRAPQGSASITSSAMLLADAWRIAFGQVNALSASASLVATADTTTRMGSASPQAQADLQAQAVVTRMVTGAVVGAAEINANAQRVLLPQVELGVEAQVSVEALRIARGQANTIIATASLTAAADQTTRDGLASPQAQADLQAQAVLTKMAVGAMASTAEINAQATRVLLPNGSLEGAAQISVTAIRITLGQANAMTSTASLTAAADQTTREGASNPQAQADLQASPMVTRMALGSLTVAADIDAQAQRVVLPNGLLDVGAQISASATRIAMGQSEAIGVNAEFTGAAERTVRLGIAHMTATSDAQAVGGMVRFVSALVGGSADMTASAIRVVLIAPKTLPYSNTFNGAGINGAAVGYAWDKAMLDIACTAEIYADVVANPDSIDPPERTLYATLRTTEFARAFIECEFRRAA